jgi:hypothetical protein
MKKLLMIMMALSLFNTSCRKPEGCTDPTARNYDIEAKKDDGSCEYGSLNGLVIEDTEINGVTYKKVQGTLTGEQTFSSDENWLISGAIFVDNGATLTIDAGVTVYTDINATTFLSIKQGGTIQAVGTSTSPIVFTPLTDSPSPGDWGGIIINGYADINTGVTAEGEGGTGTYGGNDDLDNSGTLKYVRVEYAGKILGTDNELNGFSFNGVGSGTTVEYIEAYMGSDDGIEFFGGTVNVSYAVSKGNQDDSFDWTHGWRGNGTYWYAEQLSNGGDRGIEADNNGDDNEATPYSNPTLNHITLIGYDDGDGENTGIRLREGTKGTLMNVRIYNFPKNGIRVSNQVTLDNVTNGDLSATDLNVYDNGTNFLDCDTFELENNLTTSGSGDSWMTDWTK